MYWLRLQRKEAAVRLELAAASALCQWYNFFVFLTVTGVNISVLGRWQNDFEPFELPRGVLYDVCEDPDGVSRSGDHQGWLHH